MTLPETLQQVDRTWVEWRGQTLAYFGGCDYFRLASHPEVLAAADAAMKKYGLNVAASRLTTGNHQLYQQLESALAQFFQSERALIVSNGYLTNLAVLQGLRHRFSHLLIDEAAHSSLTDAAAAAQLEIIRFGHRNPSDLDRKLPKYAKALLLTDGVFAHDGSIAPLQEYHRLLHKDAWMLIDDSHAAGVLGERGAGTPEFAGLPWDRVIQTTTLSKAFGCFGGVIVGSKEICDEIFERSPALTGATPFPLPLAAAALTATRLLTGPKFRNALQANLVRFRPGSQSPVFAVVPANEKQQQNLTRALLKRGIFPSHIRYQNGPPEGYFRFAISSEHSAAQLDALADALQLPPGQVQV